MGSTWLCRRLEQGPVRGRIMNIKAVCYGFLAISFLVMSMIGFLSPVIWPDLYQPFMSPVYGYGSFPLVQHHVEMCTFEEFIMDPLLCEEQELFIV